MNCFTVTTRHPEWDALTAECIIRLATYAGVQVEPILAKDEYDSHLQKLTVPLLTHGKTWFFDSDWWMLRHAKLPEIPEGGIIATYCRTGHERYCNCDVDLKRVFGTTLFGADMSSYKVRSAFVKAIALQSQCYWTGKPKADESFLNMAAQSLELPIHFMGEEWNHCTVPDEQTIGLHGGGMWPKLDWMRSMLATCAQA